MTTPTFLVTGATDGIGKATALALARQNANVIIHGRNPAKLAATLAQLRAATGQPGAAPRSGGFRFAGRGGALAEQVRRNIPCSAC